MGYPLADLGPGFIFTEWSAWTQWASNRTKIESQNYPFQTSTFTNISDTTYSVFINTNAYNEPRSLIVEYNRSTGVPYYMSESRSSFLSGLPTLTIRITSLSEFTMRDTALICVPKVSELRSSSRTSPMSMIGLIVLCGLPLVRKRKIQ